MNKIIAIILILTLCLTNITIYADSYVMHTVESGDSLWKIANKFNINIKTLQTLNEEIGDILYIGKLIKIRPLNDNKTIKIQVNDKILSPDQEPYLEDSTTFVPIRFIAEALNVDEIIWDDKNNTAILKENNKIIKLPIGSNIAYINGNPKKLNAPINIYKGRTFIPVRFVAEAFDSLVLWEQNSYLVKIISDELLWLSRIVEAEAQGEPFEGKLAVANVILNRKKSDLFPNSIKEVIFDSKYGIQFTPIADGRIYNTPSAESINASIKALKGENNIGNCLYFLNPNKASSSWIINNRSFYTQIANHSFYK